MNESRYPARWRAASRLAPILLATLSLAACLDDKPSAEPVQVQSTGVTANNGAPVIAGAPATETTVGVTYLFKPSVSDPEGDPVTLEIQGTPRWATFDAATGELRGTPTEADVGEASGIFMKASDGKAQTTFGPFSITVKRPATFGAPGSGVPTLSGTPPTTVVAGTGYSFQAIGSDPDGDRLSYGATNLPAWLGINTANGILSGTPSDAQVGVYADITITVTDGNTTASLAPFSITVTAATTTTNTTTTSSPTTWTQCASEGGTCSFTGTMQVRYGEPWGDRWTAPRTLTGPVPCTNAFWGDPSPGTGKRCEVQGTLVVPPSTPAEVPTGTATLVWQTPTQNTDGSALTDLTGFIIRYGTDPGALSQTVTLPDAATTRYTLQSLGRGTWYFSLVSTTAAGLQSDLAPLVSKTIF